MQLIFCLFCHTASAANPTHQPSRKRPQHHPGRAASPHPLTHQTNAAPHPAAPPQACADTPKRHSKPLLIRPRITHARAASGQHGQHISPAASPPNTPHRRKPDYLPVKLPPRLSPWIAAASARLHRTAPPQTLSRTGSLTPAKIPCKAGRKNGREAKRGNF